ncbi:hypothetical protein BG004_003395, partial [Podila humilis]
FHDEYDPTIEDSYCKHIEVDGHEYTLDITDTAGQEEYRGHWNDKFMRAGDGFLCVYSITSMGSFQELVGFRNQIWRAKESENVPIILAANKSDLEEERQVDREIGEEFARLSNAYYIETSAKTGFNISEAMLELVREIVRTREREGFQDVAGDNNYPGQGYRHYPQHRNGCETEGADGYPLPISVPAPAKCKGYQKSPTPPGPYQMEEEVEMEKGCCCIVM